MMVHIRRGWLIAALCVTVAMLCFSIIVTAVVVSGHGGRTEFVRGGMYGPMIQEYRGNSDGGTSRRVMPGLPGQPGQRSGGSGDSDGSGDSGGSGGTNQLPDGWGNLPEGHPNLKGDGSTGKRSGGLRCVREEIDGKITVTCEDSDGNPVPVPGSSGSTGTDGSASPSPSASPSASSGTN